MELDKDRFSRQLLIFSDAGQKAIQDTEVVFAGFGGLATIAFPQLCHMGVKKFSVIEFERFSKSNKNRYLGFRHDDIDPKTGIGVNKVDVAKRIAHSIDPEIQVNRIKNRLESAEGFNAVKSGKVVIGCLDSDGPRSILNELCVAYDKPYIDLATEIFEGGFGGRIAIILNGDGCLACMNGGLDQKEIRSYLAGDDQNENERAAYGLPKGILTEGSGPSIIHLNSIIASMGVQEFQALVTELSEPCRYQNYRGHMHMITKVQKPEKAGCYVCGLHKKSSVANVERYLDVFKNRPLKE